MSLRQSGEKPRNREAFEKMVKRQIDSGIPRDKAVKRARDSALRLDRKE